LIRVRTGSLTPDCVVQTSLHGRAAAFGQPLSALL
jgi:hypothetical protein